MSTFSVDDPAAVGARLKEERRKLNLTQAEFIHQVSGMSSKSTQIKYEQGIRQPDALYLKGAAKLGVDVNYVMTGERDLSSQNPELIKSLGLLELATKKITQFELPDMVLCSLRDIVYAIDTGNQPLLEFAIQQLAKYSQSEANCSPD